MRDASEIDARRKKKEGHARPARHTYKARVACVRECAHRYTPSAVFKLGCARPPVTICISKNIYMIQYLCEYFGANRSAVRAVRGVGGVCTSTVLVL